MVYNDNVHFTKEGKDFNMPKTIKNICIVFLIIINIKQYPAGPLRDLQPGIPYFAIISYYIRNKKSIKKY